MISRLNLYDENFNKIDIESIGLIGLKLAIPSPSYSSTVEELDGGGRIITEKKLQSRSLQAEFMTVANDYQDSLFQKSLLYELLGSGKAFYIEQVHRPNILWECQLGEWNPSQMGTSITTFSIPLTCYKGYGESINIAKTTFNESSFIFKNEGNVRIDLRRHPDTMIKFKGASTDLTIKNKTTNETWKYYGTTNTLDWLTLQSVNSTKNFGMSIFKDTNKKILTFDVNNNEIELSGATGSFELEISTRFYFL